MSVTSRLHTCLVAPLSTLVVLASLTLSTHAQAGAGLNDAHDDATPAVQHSAVEDFTSNGCTFFPDGRFYTCCFAHDWEHWAGGTKADRWRSDVALRRCVIDLTGGRALANIIYSGVRLARLPGAIFGDGWSRAWKRVKRARYGPLSEAELDLLRAKTASICDALTLNLETGRYQVNGGPGIRGLEAQTVCPARFGLPDPRRPSGLP
jgi:hypothetical protein